jgi:hypothetical protein
MPCRITKVDKTTIYGNFTIIRCTGRERNLHIYFLRVVSLLFELLPEKPTKKQVSNAIRTLINLFRSMTSAPRKSLQGLWAELFVIDYSTNPKILLQSWHHTPYDRHDFNMGNERLEVKSTSQQIRQHHFSLEQLAPIQDVEIIIASLFTERVSSGVTVMDLVDRIRPRLQKSSDLIAHLDLIVASTLGSNWISAFDEPFDRELAANSLQFYYASNIPSVQLPLPSGVSHVHFQSDLSMCESLSLSDFSTNSVLYSAFHKKY